MLSREDQLEGALSEIHDLAAGADAYEDASSSLATVLDRIAALSADAPAAPPPGEPSSSTVRTRDAIQADLAALGAEYDAGDLRESEYDERKFDLLEEAIDAPDAAAAEPHLARNLSTERSCYVTDEDRYVVMFAVGVPAANAGDVEDAVRDAIDTTKGEGGGDAQWLVLDRSTGQVSIVEHDDVEVDPLG